MRKAAIEIAEGPWNASVEEKKARRWASSDGSGDSVKISWSKYGRAFAVRKGKGNKFGDFGFQHHVVRDGNLVLHRRGIMAAWAAAQGARAGKPNATAIVHLKPHRQKMFDNPKKESTKSRHAFDKCMECDRPPVVEVIWAERQARAWFCATCFVEWKRDNEGDIVEQYKISDGVVEGWRSKDKHPRVIPAFIARAHASKGSVVRLVVKDDYDRPRYWGLDEFGPALRQLTKIIGCKDQVELEFNPDGDEDTEPLCDLVISVDDIELVRAATIRLTLLGVGEAGSQEHAPAGLLVEVNGIRVMFDGGQGPGGDSLPKGKLDAWFVTDENSEQMEAIKPLAEELGVKAWAGSFHKGDVTISSYLVGLTGRTTYGYTIRIGDKTIVWAPEFGEYPCWCGDVELLFADGVTNFASVAANAEKSEVKQLVFARIGEQSGNTEPELAFGEWGDDGDTYTPAFARKTDDESYEVGVSEEARPLMMGMDVTEKAADEQYTFGVVYKATESKKSPELDAHREYIISEDLQKAAWGYVKTGDRRVYLQHGVQGIIPLGEWVDLVTWPYEVTTELKLPGQKAKKTMIPAGSVWMGVLWNDMGWDLVKAGQIRGFSLGGFQKKVAV